MNIYITHIYIYIYIYIPLCVSNDNDDDVCIYEQFISWAELVKHHHYLNGKASSLSEW